MCIILLLFLIVHQTNLAGEQEDDESMAIIPYQPKHFNYSSDSDNDEEQETPSSPCLEYNLMQFVKKGDTQRLEQALQDNPSLAEKVFLNGTTLLHEATAAHQETCAQMLLQKGANPTTCNHDGNSPIDIAKRNCYESLHGILTAYRDRPLREKLKREMEDNQIRAAKRRPRPTQQRCPVCLEPCRFFVRLGCKPGHRIHQHCLPELQQYGDGTCPICRAPKAYSVKEKSPEELEKENAERRAAQDAVNEAVILAILAEESEPLE